MKALALVAAIVLCDGSLQRAVNAKSADRRDPAGKSKMFAPRELWYEEASINSWWGKSDKPYPKQPIYECTRPSPGSS